MTRKFSKENLKSPLLFVFTMFDNWITEKSSGTTYFVREDAAKCETTRTKTKKGREFGKIIFFVKNFGEFRKKIICNIWRHNCVCICLKSLPFLFYTNFYIFLWAKLEWLSGSLPNRRLWAAKPLIIGSNPMARSNIFLTRKRDETAAITVC